MRSDPFARRLRKAEFAAKEAGITAAELCSRIGINRATYQRWKSGASAPSLKYFEAFCAVEASIPMDEAA